MCSFAGPHLASLYSAQDRLAAFPFDPVGFAFYFLLLKRAVCPARLVASGPARFWPSLARQTGSVFLPAWASARFDSHHCRRHYLPRRSVELPPSRTRKPAVPLERQDFGHCPDRAHRWASQPFALCPTHFDTN